MQCELVSFRAAGRWIFVTFGRIPISSLNAKLGQSFPGFSYIFKGLIGECYSFILMHFCWCALICPHTHVFPSLKEHWLYAEYPCFLFHLPSKKQISQNVPLFLWTNQFISKLTNDILYDKAGGQLYCVWLVTFIKQALILSVMGQQRCYI